MIGFKPQGTTMDTFSNTEKNLYEQFSKFGYSKEVSEAIAYSFTQYILGYLTDEGVARKITDAGADARTALAIVNAFREAKRNSLANSTNHVPNRSAPEFCHAP